MVSSYARIKLNLQEAMDRFSHWVGFAPLGPPKMTESGQVVSSATADGKWVSKVAMWIFEVDGWAVFECNTGYFGSLTAEKWLEFAKFDELVFAAYNESIHCGQLIVINNGVVVRNFLDDRQDPSDNKNQGRLPVEETEPIEAWWDAAQFAEEDRLAWPPDGMGLLWMFGKAD